MSDEQDQTTTQVPAADPAPDAAAPEASATGWNSLAQTNPEAAKWRNLTAVAGAMFVIALAVLGFQAGSDNDGSPAAQRFDTRGGMHGEGGGQGDGRGPHAEGGDGPGFGHDQGTGPGQGD